MGLRFVYSPNRSWNRYRTMLRTIVEEGESDNETQYKRNSNEVCRPLNLKPTCKTSRKPNMEFREDFESSDFQNKNGVQKRDFYAHTIKAEPKSLTLTNISTRSTKIHTNESLNDEDLACRLFPEFFAEQLDHDIDMNSDVSCKPDVDPLVDSWLGFYGK